MKRFIWQRPAQESEFEQELTKDITEICKKRKNLAKRYNYIDDNDLIEASIYEELALKARYEYLLRVAKANDVKLNKNCIYLDG